jgi:hypothetical protein
MLVTVDTEMGEVVNLTLMHEGNNLREFYSKLPRPVLVGTEATGFDAVVSESDGGVTNRLPGRSPGRATSMKKGIPF